MTTISFKGLAEVLRAFTWQRVAMASVLVVVFSLFYSYGHTHIGYAEPYAWWSTSQYLPLHLTIHLS